MSEVFTKHRQVFDRKVRDLHLAIASIECEGRNRGFEANEIAMMCDPYFLRLENIYEEELPFIKALDDSDLLLCLQGRAVSVENPRVSLITGVFQKVRSQVASVAKSIAQLSESNRKIPAQLDLGLSAYARGSLILGFTLPPPEGLQYPEQGQESLLRDQDPLYKAARDAIRTIGIVTERITESPENQVVDDIYRAVEDPEVRDAAITAVSFLSPSKRMGVESVSISGREAFKGKRILTPESKKILRPVLSSPVLKGEPGSIIGEMREIDLDAKRFIVRNIENETVSQLRCSYAFKPESHTRRYIGKKIIVKGKIERDANGRPRLMQVNSIEDFDDDSKSRALFE
jgi:hypothetical protein